MYIRYEAVYICMLQLYIMIVFLLHNQILLFLSQLHKTGLNLSGHSLLCGVSVQHHQNHELHGKDRDFEKRVSPDCTSVQALLHFYGSFPSNNISPTDIANVGVAVMIHKRNRFFHLLKRYCFRCIVKEHMPFVLLPK